MDLFKRNIVCLFVIKSSFWFLLIMPIIILFYESNGLSMLDIMTLQAVYSITIVILEIPTGYFADVLGRKNTMVTGALMGFMGYVIYCFSGSFYQFLLAEIILGIGQSLISGTDSALLYDTLIQSKKEKEYVKYEGRIGSAGNFSEAIAGITGGLLATISIRFPFIVQASIVFISIPAALLLIEPQRFKIIQRIQISNIISILKTSLISNSKLRYYIFYSSIIGSATLTMAWFVQPYFKLISIPLFFYGILWTLLNLSVGLTSLFAYKIEEKIGKNSSLLIISIIIPLTFIILGFINSIGGLIILILFYFSRGFATPVLKDYINKFTDSNIRATVLSIRNFILRLCFSIFAPLAGWIADTKGLNTSFIFIGILYFLLILLCFLFFSGNKINLKNR